MRIPVNRYPQLQGLCWNRPADAIVDGPEALALYERNWRFVDVPALPPEERQLIDTLVAAYGNEALQTNCQFSNFRETKIFLY